MRSRRERNSLLEPYETIASIGGLSLACPCWPSPWTAPLIGVWGPVPRSHGTDWPTETKVDCQRDANEAGHAGVRRAQPELASKVPSSSK